MATPTTDANCSISSLYSTGLKPVIVEGILLRLLKGLFARTDNLYSEQLRDYRWSKDDRTTKIWITPVYTWKVDTLQARPALVVKRNGWQLRQLGIGAGQYTAVNWDMTDQTNRPMGHPECQVAIEGSSTIFVISKLPAECELLATEIFIHLVQNAELIKDEFDFKKFVVMEIGGLAKLDESEEYFIIPITVAYAALERWRLVKESPLFKGISVKKDIGS